MDASYPLSAAQSGIWFGAQERAGAARFLQAGYVDIEGPLSLDLLRDAIEHVVAGSSALRLGFAERDGMPLQYIRESVPIELPLVDLAHESDPAARALEWMMEERRRPREAQSGSMLTHALLRLTSTRHFLFSKEHHLVLDGTGAALLMRAIAGAYDHLVTSGTRGAQPPDLYESYLREEASFQGRAGSSTERQFWLEVQSKPITPITLSVAATPAAAADFRRLSLPLTPQTAAAVPLIATRLHTTVPRLMLAAVVSCLHRLTGQSDLTVGFPVSARSGKFRNLIGMCSNILYPRFTVDRASTFARLVAHVDEQLWRAFLQQRYRHEDLRRELGIRPGERNPFGVSFNCKRANDLLRFGTARGRLCNLSNGPVEDFAIVLNQGPGEALELDFDFNPALYEDWEVRSLIACFDQILRAALADPDLALGQLPRLGPSMRRQVLAEVSLGERLEVPRKCLHEIFREQAVRNPRAVAVVCGPDQLSYAQLNEQSERLARRLRAYGAGPEVVIGLCMERSLAMIVGLLGILKSGAAYLPLDPSYPVQRLALMVSDAAAPLLLINEPTRHKLVPPEGARVLRLEALLTEEDDAVADSTALPPCDPRTLAYVIYTSGSTGTPKGVMVSHAGLTNLAAAQSAGFHVGPSSRVLQFARLGFDASVSEIAMALYVGAALHLTASSVLWSPEELAQNLVAQRITTVTLPPAVLPFLQQFELPDLDTLIVAGEACPAEATEIWPARCRFINAYGPTEVTVCGSFGTVERGHVVPIGRPMPNGQVYVLDECLEPVPVGVSGELYIGGVGVARGYRGRPGLSAERFVPDPFSEAPGARMYRTGDLGRYREDGRLEFLGRADQQVKIRGYRVEPAEIEAQLSRHEQVRQAVVVLRQESDGERRLVGYVVSDSGAEQAGLGARLREYLRERVPEYMVPSAIVVLEKLPLTANGKLDRGSLPAPQGREVRNEYEAPRTELESTLARVWSEVLRLERVGIHDNFFELGGDSIQSVQIVARLGRLGVGLTTRQFFLHQTIAGLSTVARMRATEAVVQVIPDEYLATAAGSRELRYWLSLPWAQVQRLPEQGATATPSGNRAALTVSLPSVATHALPDVLDNHNAQISEVLLTALLSAWQPPEAGCATATVLLLELDGSPVVLRLDRSLESVAALQSVKEQLRGRPEGMMGYHWLREAAGAEQLRALPDSLVSFHCAVTQSRAHAQHPLTVGTRAGDGELKFDWEYDSGRAHIVTGLARRYVQCLEQLIEECRHAPRVFTLADFPLLTA